MSKIPTFFHAIRQGPYVHVRAFGQHLGLFDPEDGETLALAKQLRGLADQLDPPILLPEGSLLPPTGVSL